MPPLIHQDYRPRRRWPPSPTVEEESISLSKEYEPLLFDTSKEEARFRGEIDQLPMIIDVNPPLPAALTPSRIHPDFRKRPGPESYSSSEHSSPHTPSDNDWINNDRRYVYIPEKGIEIPITYEEPRIPKYEKRPRTPREMDESRSRKDLSRLETDLPGINTPWDRPPGSKRTPSPYAYTSKSMEAIYDAKSGGNVTSADIMSPSVVVSHSDTKHSPQRTRHDRKISGEGAGTRPVRPPMNRHTAEIGSPGGHPNAGRYRTPAQSAPYPDSSDELDLSPDIFSPSPMRHDPGLTTPQSPPKYSMPRPEYFSKRRGEGELPHGATYPPTPPPSTHEKGINQSNWVSPSSPGLHSRYALPSSPGSPYGNMPPLSPVSHYGNIPPSSPRSQNEYMPPSSPRVDRRTSPQGPPMTSPPSATPNPHSRGVSHSTKPRNRPPGLKPMSRPASPVQPSETRSFGTSTLNRSELTTDINRQPTLDMSQSPSSPGIEGASYIQAPPRIDVREPSPALPEEISHEAPERIPKPLSLPASLTPFLIPQPPDIKTIAPGGRRRALSNVETRPKISFGESHSETLVLPLHPPRARSRPSTRERAVSFGSQPLALLPCPRPIPVAGFTDWYTLIGNSSFSICPSCRHAVFSAGYETLFQPRRHESPGFKRRCDFSTPWTRMVILLTIATKRPDPKLIYAMSDIIVDEMPCPGKGLVVGQWYRVFNVESGKQVSGFDVCPYCVRNIETIFPILRGVFQKSRSKRPDQKRMCDLRADSKRFTAYIDLLESTANQAKDFNRPPNTLRFTDLAEKMAAIPECSRDDMLLDQVWHTTAHIPELTVCEDCYREVVRPASRQGYAVAAQFSRRPHRAGPRDLGISCQLYSSRMRGAFMDACRRDDLTELKQMALQRHRVEGELQRETREVQRADMGDDEKTARITGLVEEWKRWE